ncbi:MAG: hypothetical protein Q4E03_01235 [Trueperella sp.]|nr:hypothetical protein [Trueperella sp.]
MSETNIKKASWRTVVGMILLPVLVLGGFLGLALSQDAPAGAIVNNDQMADVAGEPMRIGDEVAQGMIDDPSIAWEVVDAETAEKGLKDGKYAAVVTIPSDFTKVASSFTTMDANVTDTTHIDIKVSDQTTLVDGLVSQIVNYVATDSVNQALQTAFAEGVFDGFNEISGAFDDIIDGAQQIRDGSDQLRDGAGEAHAGTVELKAGTAELRPGAAELDAGAAELRAGVKMLKDGAEMLSKDAVDEVYNGYVGELAPGILAYVDGTEQLYAGYDDVRGGAAGVALLFGAASVYPADAVSIPRVDKCYGITGKPGAFSKCPPKETTAPYQWDAALTDAQNSYQEIQTNAKRIMEMGLTLFYQDSSAMWMVEPAFVGGFQGALETVATSIGGSDVPLRNADGSSNFDAWMQYVLNPNYMNAASIEARMEGDKAICSDGQLDAAGNVVTRPCKTGETPDGLAGKTNLMNGLDLFKQMFAGQLLDGELDANGLPTNSKAQAAQLVGGVQEVAVGLGAVKAGMDSYSYKLVFADNSEIPLVSEVPPVFVVDAKGMPVVDDKGNPVRATKAQVEQALGAKIVSVDPKTEGQGLKSGLTELYDGTGELKDGTTQIADGAVQLDDGAAMLEDGLRQISDGTVELNEGAILFESELVAGKDDIPSFTKDEKKIVSEAAGLPVTKLDVVTPGTNYMVALLIASVLWGAGLIAFASRSGRELAAAVSSPGTWGKAIAKPGIINAIIGAVLGLVGAAVAEAGASAFIAMLLLGAMVGVSFTLINHGLVGWLGNIGRAIIFGFFAFSIILGITGGVTPWLRSLVKISPVENASDLFRAVMTGGSFAGLLIGAIVFLVIGVVLSLSLMVKNRNVSEEAVATA